jgi:hypothetical protein
MGATVAYIFGGDTCLVPVRRLATNTIARMAHAVTQNQRKIVKKSRYMGTLALAL